jgi:mannan endo-1,6-alpha-mannosidase
VVIAALLNPMNAGPNWDYMPPEHADEEGNDDLFFWGSAVIAAAERNFPQPDATKPAWIELGANVFNSLVSRWNTTHCAGGLTWQIYPDNPNGMNYKNSVSNGGFFQLATRMARATGNATYLEWAERVWDWSWDIGFIDHDNYHVYDGTDSANNCSEVTAGAFTYTTGIYLYGAAVLANHTGDDVWADRATRLLEGGAWFFSPFDNATDVMYEAACEGPGTCNADMTTHKAYLSRYMWQSTWMLPSLTADVERLLGASAKGAAQSCTGGDNGYTCGVKWYTGGYDGTPGLGQQMSALEVIQGWLIADAAPPLRGDDIKTVRETNWTAVDPYRPDPVEEVDDDTTPPQDTNNNVTNDEDDDSSAIRIRASNNLVDVSMFCFGSIALWLLF